MPRIGANQGERDEQHSSSEGSLLAKLILDDTEKNNNVKTTSKTAAKYVEKPEKIVPTVEDVIIPDGKTINYEKWGRSDVREFFMKFLEDSVVASLMKQRITGKNLYYCFLNKETSEEWRRKIQLRHGVFQKVRMVIGRVHNIYYGLEVRKQ